MTRPNETRPNAAPSRADTDVSHPQRRVRPRAYTAPARTMISTRRDAAAGSALANRAYWLVQDDWSGDLRTSVRAADVIVAAALLAELIDATAIDVPDGAVQVYTPMPPLDHLGSEVAMQLAAEPGISAADAIDGLAPTVRGRVAARLIGSGAAVRRRVGWRRREIAVARAGDTGPAWVRAGLAMAVERGLPLSEADCVLLQLVRYSSVAGNPLTAAPPERMADALRRLDRGTGR